MIASAIQILAIRGEGCSLNYFLLYIVIATVSNPNIDKKDTIVNIACLNISSVNYESFFIAEQSEELTFFIFVYSSGLKSIKDTI
jgi:hypothetical protein